MHTRLPPLDYWCICSFFLLGPGPLHKIEVLPSSGRPCTRVRYNSNSFVQPPVVSKLFFSISLFLSASFFLSSIVSFTPVTYGRIFVVDGTASFLLNLRTFTRLRYLVIFHLAIWIFGTISHLAHNLFSCTLFSLYRHFNFLASPIVFKRVHSEFNF